MTIVNTIDITKEKHRYNKNGKSKILPPKEPNPSNIQSIATAIALQIQNPTNSIPKNSRNKTNRPNHFLCFSFFILHSPLQFYKMLSTICGYCHKVFLTLCVLCFVNICPNGSTGSCKLICQIGTFGRSYTINKINDCNCKFKR